MSSIGDSNPPPTNPILSAYETFVRDTPLITRYVLTLQVFTCFLGFFTDLSWALGNTVHFTIHKMEFHRILLSPFASTGLFSLIFSYVSLVDSGRRLEFCMGSTHFAILLLLVAVVTNVSFLALAFFLWALSGNNWWLYTDSFGIWVIIFALIELDCCKAPPSAMRRLFLFTVPTVYYPLALFGLFAVIGGFHFSYLLAICVGYLYGYVQLIDFLFGATSTSNSSCLFQSKTWTFRSIEGWLVPLQALGRNHPI